MLREIVNGAQLAAHINKKVSITGFVTERDPRNGLWFDLRSTDNQIVRITLKRPLDGPVEGYVEVKRTMLQLQTLCNNHNTTDFRYMEYLQARVSKPMIISHLQMKSLMQKPIILFAIF